MIKSRDGLTAQSIFLMAAANLVLGACTAGPSPSTDVLGSEPVATVSTVPQVGLPVILVRSACLPDYSDTTDLVRRCDGQGIPGRTGQWDERLSVGMTRTLAADLTGRLPGMAVITAMPIEPPTREIRVDTESFAARTDGPVVLVARWSITDAAAHETLFAARRSLTIPIDGAGDAAVVAAMTRAINDLSAQPVTRVGLPYAIPRSRRACARNNRCARSPNIKTRIAAPCRTAITLLIPEEVAHRFRDDLAH